MDIPSRSPPPHNLDHAHTLLVGRTAMQGRHVIRQHPVRKSQPAMAHRADARRSGSRVDLFAALGWRGGKTLRRRRHLDHTETPTHEPERERVARFNL